MSVNGDQAECPAGASACTVFSSVFEKGSSEQYSSKSAKRINMLDDESKVLDNSCGVISVLGKRRRSATVQVLAVALCPNIHQRELTSATQRQQKQPHWQRQRQPQQQQQQNLLKRSRITLWPGSLPQAPYCASNATQSKRWCRCCGSTLELGMLQNEQHVEQYSCLYNSPIKGPAISDINCRQQEKLTCPAAPSKPASKPKKATLASSKKFFVPSNLNELPPAFQALFT